MTTPDHRPYLTDTDLRTPEDVLAWLDVMALTSSERIAPIQWSMAMAHARLRAHLDRERRQACRRAARLEWRRVCELVRWCDAYRNTDAAWHEVAPSMWRALTLALAFRAAARQP